MTAYKLIGKLLKFKGFVCTGFDFRRGGRLVVLVKPYKNGCRCPECGRRGTIVRQRAQPRYWRDIPIGPWSVWLMYWPREIRCATHGRVTEQVPWADAGARVSYRFEYLMLRYCQIMTQKAAAELLRLPRSTLSDLLHRSIQTLRAGHRIRALKVVGIDEISYHKGHKYATLVYDLERSCVVWVGAGKGREAADRFFNEALSDYQKARIQTACCDMSQAYIGAIKAHCPNAALVLDRFHIVKALNAAVDEVRKEQWREASQAGRKALKGLRWLLSRHSSTRTRRDTRNLKALDKHNRRIYRAWRLKEEFEHFWTYKAPWAAERFLKRWTKSALLSRLEPMREFVHTLRRHQSAVIAFIDTQVTNATAEGLNRIVRMVKNRASGYRHLDALSDMIYLTVGDLDLPAQIPARFRTL
mgnify:CR=1 FL=1